LSDSADQQIAQSGNVQLPKERNDGQVDCEGHEEGEPTERAESPSGEQNESEQIIRTAHQSMQLLLALNSPE
jgi:hypothetical protein